MNPSPHHEGPVGAVPEAAEQHGEHQVQVCPGSPPAVSPERDIQIIAQPTAEAHVPAPPKVLQTLGQIRLPEVHHEVKAEQLGAAARDAAVAAEVAVNLPRKRHGTQYHGH